MQRCVYVYQPVPSSHLASSEGAYTSRRCMGQVQTLVPPLLDHWSA